jgi:hypothetical protein
MKISICRDIVFIFIFCYVSSAPTTTTTTSRTTTTTQYNVSDASFHYLWEKFKKDFNRIYPDAKIEARRFQIFKTNVRLMYKQNLFYTFAQDSFSTNLNRFSDWSKIELLNNNYDINRYPALIFP